MLAHIFICATLFTSALSTAMPLSSGHLENALSMAENRGIDVSGPIPGDAQPTDGGYTFAAGSDASVWVLAQIALPTSPDIEKRQLANIGIGMFYGQWCLGGGLWVDNVSYGDPFYYNNVPFASVGISYRGLAAGEHLDFSKELNTKGSSGPPNLCGIYVYSAGAFTPVGCFNSQPINCFRLWH